MKKGDVLEIRTIDKRGFSSFQFLEVVDARSAKKVLAAKGYHLWAEPNTYLSSHRDDASELTRFLYELAIDEGAPLKLYEEPEAIFDIRE